MYVYERHAHEMYVYEMHAHRTHACGIHGRERDPRERHVRSIHVSEALTTPAGEEWLEPFYKLLEGSAGASEVNNSKV
jgi:hypothetical protein